MQTIKFLPNNLILLNKTTLLTKVKYTKDSNVFYTINNFNYEENEN